MSDAVGASQILTTSDKLESVLELTKEAQDILLLCLLLSALIKRWNCIDYLN